MDKLISNLPADLRRYLYNVYLIKEHNDMLTVEDYCPYNIKYIINPSEVVQLAAVQKCGCAIQYIHSPSEAVQVAAVEQNWGAIDWLRNPSKAVQVAVKDIYNSSKSKSKSKI